MRPSEIISASFFAVFVLGGLLAPIGATARARTVATGLAGILAAAILARLEPSAASTIARDFAPSAFLLLGYWQTGSFVTGSNPRVQRSLESFDARWFPGAARASSGLQRHRVVSHYLEVAYMACYPVVPLGIVALYATGHQDSVDGYWRVVLPATFATHALTTVFQSWPPWMREETATVRDPAVSALRSVNRWVTDNASIKANSFPSGHVSSSFAIALVLLAEAPAVGAGFLWIAASIAVSSVLLRYHYVLDVILGIALSVASYLLLW